MPKPVVIVAAGPQGRIISEVCGEAGVEVRGFLDDTRQKGGLVQGAPVLGGFALLDDRELLSQMAFIVALGEPGERRRWSEHIAARGGVLATVRHPSSFLSPTARIGPGSFLNYATAVYADARVGDYLILETHASIGHDNVVGEAVFIGPGARLTGRVRCGADSFVGAGAVIRPDVVIGAGVTIGAGAVVVGDIDDGVTVAGNPARVVPSKGSGPREP